MNCDSLKKNSTRFMLFLIVSLVQYWTGNVHEEVKSAAGSWLPEDMESIPLQVSSPEDEQKWWWGMSNQMTEPVLNRNYLSPGCSLILVYFVLCLL